MEGGGAEMTGMAGSRRPRILIVDDEPAIVEALRDTLSDRGYDPVGFTDGTAALAGLEAGRFDLLLADLSMPRIGGVDLLREAQRRDPDLVGVIMTGDGTIATAVEAMKTGALDYILKPLKMSVILPVLARALTVRRLRTENAALERSVRERTAQLEAALRDLEAQTAERLRAEQALMQAQKLEAVGRLTGGVAHNFNNLLMAIDGALQLLDKRLDPEHVGRKYVDCARQATERGAKVTGELLAFSRTQRFDLRPTEIGGALRAGQSIFAQAAGPTVRFNLDLGDDDIWAMTDPDQLELAVVNLAINARDALPDGGDITLGLTVEDAVAPTVAVWLRDTGTGMSSEVAARALEPFFTTKERGKGTGLGLAQVYGFARQCGGEVRIDSAPGLGTTVTMVLPRTAAPAVLDAPPKAAASRILEGGAEGVRLLVVDDDDAVRQILVDGLRLEGFEVAEAADGETGLQALRRDPPDALVVDYAMPGMNGAEVAKQARVLRPGLPVVFCSGYADTLALDDIEDAPLVRKPVVVSALGRMVVDLIARQGG
ncbi:response regulator [Caulobacter sp. LjRoot300]|uniref:response regulator n=1 Tax=Caulobacter sp. LjRoot300 TaxID=3342321 RepID=UPI003ED08F5C